MILQKRVLELQQELLETSGIILQLELRSNSQLDRIKQVAIESEEAEDEIIEADTNVRHENHNKTLPVTTCSRHPPRKSIINYLI